MIIYPETPGEAKMGIEQVAPTRQSSDPAVGKNGKYGFSCEKNQFYFT